MKPLKIKDFSAEIEREVNMLAETLWKHHGCISSLNHEFTSTTTGIAIDVTLPANEEIFLPSNPKVSVFKIDTGKQAMTLLYFPHVKDRTEVQAN